jgi:RNA polymerase-associated protein RTF1
VNWNWLNERKEYRKLIQLDQLEEKLILKKKLKQKESGNEKLTERQKKGHSFETLRKKREQKQGKTVDAKDKATKKYRGYDWESDRSDYSDYDQPEKEKFKLKLEDVLAIQVKRDDLEEWLHKPMFVKSVTGCFIRVSLGTSAENREPVYRCVYIHDIHGYKRKYKFNNCVTDYAMLVSQGKAKKDYLFDMVSNQAITEKEWNRFEVTMKVDHHDLPSEKHLAKKKKDLESIRNHIFTEIEINEMIAKKKETQIVGNATMEEFRVEHALEAAKFTGEFEKIADLEKQLEDLQSINASSRLTTTVDLIAKLNARNKEMDLKESQEAELRALQEKRKHGRVNVTDPFARRKTQPVHIITSNAGQEYIHDLESSKSISVSAQQSAEILDSEDEDPFENIDVSIIEEGTMF